MRPEEQTDEIKVHLYELVKNFVYKYQRKYFYQYRDDLDDLVMEIYSEFLTPKSRDNDREKESLLDKFDYSTMPQAKGMTKELYFAKVVQIAVIRMLIDRSRSSQSSELIDGEITPYRFLSIDEMKDEFGDVVISGYGLIDEETYHVDKRQFDVFERRSIIAKFKSLPYEMRDSILKDYLEMRCAVNDTFKALFEELLDITYSVQVITPDGVFIGRIYNVTDKTIQVNVLGENYNFDKVTRRSRNKRVPMILSQD